MKKSLGFIALISIFALQAGAASACPPGAQVYSKNGEHYCFATSDGGGEAYKPSSFQVTNVGQGDHSIKPKALLAVEAAQRRAHHIY